MNVLSLFDGMSCGQIALNRTGISYGKYYASEIDKHAIKVTQHNYPDTIQLGSVTEIKGTDLPQIDLLIGGSPCQGFSFAGKGLNFEDPRSKLFFEFVRLVNECKPKYFLLENVKMKKEHELVISQYMKVAPIEINSALLSAQNRVRLYWTNIAQMPYGLFDDMITNIPQPKDRGILLKQILEDEVSEKYFLTQKALEYVTNEERMKKGYTAINGDKGLGLNANGTWNNTGTLITESIKNEKATTIDASYYKGFGVRSGKCRQVVEGMVKLDKQGNVKSNQEKAGCLCGGGNSGGNHSDMDLLFINEKIRRLTPIECERLQTVPDGYTKFVSDTQRYRMLGNGWTVDVIAYIFGFMKSELAKSAEW